MLSKLPTQVERYNKNGCDSLGLDEDNKGGALAEVGVNALLSSRIDCASSIGEARVEDKLSA